MGQKLLQLDTLQLCWDIWGRSLWGFWSLSHLPKQWELRAFRVLHWPLREKIPHCQKLIKGKIWAFWHFLGWNEFLMILNIILKWCGYLSRANYFGFCNMYCLINVHYSCWKIFFRYVLRLLWAFRCTIEYICVLKEGIYPVWEMQKRILSWRLCVGGLELG